VNSARAAAIGGLAATLVVAVSLAPRMMHGSQEFHPTAATQVVAPSDTMDTEVTTSTTLLAPTSITAPDLGQRVTAVEGRVNTVEQRVTVVEQRATVPTTLISPLVETRTAPTPTSEVTLTPTPEVDAPTHTPVTVAPVVEETTTTTTVPTFACTVEIRGDRFIIVRSNKPRIRLILQAPGMESYWGGTTDAGGIWAGNLGVDAITVSAEVPDEVGAGSCSAQVQS
jgi:hypothetical protein